MQATSNLSTELGSGGFGKVFLAINLRSKGTKAAVKVLTMHGIIIFYDLALMHSY